MDQVALNITKKLPSPIDACGRVPFGIITDPNESQAVGRVDYQKSAKHTIFARYMFTTFAQPIPFTLDPSNVLVTVTGGRDNLAQSVTVGDTYLLGPNMVNSFRAAFNRTAIQRASVDEFGPSDVGVQGVYSYTPHQMLMSVTGGFTIGNGTESNSNFRGNTHQLGDDVQRPRARQQQAGTGREQKQHIHRERDQEDQDLGDGRTDHVRQIRSYSTRRIPAVAPQI